MDEGCAQRMSGLEPAVKAGIVQSNVDASGSTNSPMHLIRETIYEDLHPVERLRLPAVRGMLSSAFMRASRPALSRIAHHYHEAAALGNTEKLLFMRCGPPRVQLDVCYEEGSCTTTMSYRRWRAAA